jgi:hypothetical protein
MLVTETNMGDEVLWLAWLPPFSAYPLQVAAAEIVASQQRDLL